MRKPVVGDRIRILSCDQMADSHVSDSAGDLVFGEGDSYFTGNNKCYCGKEFIVGAVEDEGETRYAIVDPDNPDAEGGFNENNWKVIYLHPGMYEFVDKPLKAGMTVRIRDWDDMLSRFKDEYGDIFIEEDSCNFIPDMKKYCGEEFVLEADVIYAQNDDYHVKNFVKKIQDDEEDRYWLITAGMVEIIDGGTSPEFNPDLEFLKAIGVG